MNSVFSAISFEHAVSVRCSSIAFGLSQASTDLSLHRAIGYDHVLFDPTHDSKEGIPPDHLCLIHPDKQLEDGYTLSEHIGHVKAKIQDKKDISPALDKQLEGIPPDRLCLIFLDKQLEDGYHLLDHIGHVKATCQDKKGISPPLWSLTIADKQLEEGRTLSDIIDTVKNKIQDKKEAPPPDRRCLISHDKQLKDGYTLSRNIGHVKAKIQDKKGIPTIRRLNIAAHKFEKGRTLSDILEDHVKRLTIADKQFEDSHALPEDNIQKQSTRHLVPAGIQKEHTRHLVLRLRK